MRVGKQMQFFGARVNIAKALLYAINGGRDEVSGKQVAPVSAPVEGDVLDYEDVAAKYDTLLDWLAETYVDALNCVHYMHDKYAYERLEMALHDRQILRTMACGIAGLSVVADSLSAIKYAKVTPVRDEDGLVTDYVIEGDFPKYGNDDDRADDIAVGITKAFMEKIRQHKTYRTPTCAACCRCRSATPSRPTACSPCSWATRWSRAATSSRRMRCGPAISTCDALGQYRYRHG
jgi:formate C-acetyltransferase